MIRINRVLTAVTNRCDGFENPDMNTTQDLLPQPEVATRVREALGLNARGNDHPVLFLLMCLESYPDLLDRFSEQYRTYQIGSGLRWVNQGPFVLSKGNLLTSSRFGPPNVRRRLFTNEWPAAREIIVTQKDDGLLVEVADQRETVLAPEISTGDLSVEWPTWSGVVGNLAAGSLTGPEDQLKIRHLPSSPSIEQIRRLVVLPECYKFMQTQSLSGPFFDRVNSLPHEAMACLLCALGLSNTNL